MKSIKLSAAQIEALATDSGTNFASSDLFSVKAIEQTVTALTGADFKLHEAYASVWKKAYVENRPDLKQGAADTAWSRHFKSTDLVKPKATSTEATKKAEARQKAQAAMVAKSSPTLNVELAESKVAVGKALENGDTKAIKAATAKMDTIKAELTRREKDAGKTAQDALASKRKAIKAMIDLCNMETLGRIEAMIGKKLEPAPDMTEPAKKPAKQKRAA